MPEELRIAGKRIAFPKEYNEWKLSVHPGGWVIAERELPEGGVERRRLSMIEQRGRLAAKIVDSRSSRLWSGELQSVSAASGRHVTARDGAGDTDLVAQFPGKVRKILVQEGAGVSENDPLILIEAMKMEFVIKAPCQGRIAKLRVIEGQTLSPGDRFLDFAEPENLKEAHGR